MVAENDGDKLNGLDAEYARLHRTIGLTIGARFNAFRRHKNRNRTSQVAIIILSSYTLLFSMVASFIEIGNKQAVKELSLFSVFMSVLIIAFSLFESSKRHDARSELFAKSAVQLSGLRDRIAITISSEDKIEERLRNYFGEYHNIMQTFGDSHSEIDFRQHYRVSAESSVITRYIDMLIYLLNIWIMPIIALISPFILFGMVVSGRIAYKWYNGFISELNLPL